MGMLGYLTRGNSTPSGKTRIFFCCHPEDYELFFNEISGDILDICNCAVYYYQDNGDEFQDDIDFSLLQMNLFVVPVTRKLLFDTTKRVEHELDVARNGNIPILPIMQESGIVEPFKEKFGKLQYLNRFKHDDTAIPYRDKLKTYLESVVYGDDLAEKIRQAFDAYIFLSYRKKDRREAQKLMSLIHENEFARDIAIWYDEFLVPGEDFNDFIRKALDKSSLFVLAVTPNLIDDNNYILRVEYPMAVESNKPIVPVEMIPTDDERLKSLCQGIPDKVSAEEKDKLAELISQKLPKEQLMISSEPQHLFFIGLAYQMGVDVEKNTAKAIELLSKSAESGLDEAMVKLSDIYMYGDGVPVDYDKALNWSGKLVDKYMTITEKSHKEKDLHDLIDLVIKHGEKALLTKDYKTASKAFEKSYLFSKMLAFQSPHENSVLRALNTIKKVFKRSEFFSDAMYSLIYSGRSLLELYSDLGYVDKAADYGRKTAAWGISYALMSDDSRIRNQLLAVYGMMFTLCYESGNLKGAMEWFEKERDMLSEDEDLESVLSNVRFLKEYCTILDAEGNLDKSCEITKISAERCMSLYEEYKTASLLDLLLSINIDLICRLETKEDNVAAIESINSLITYIETIRSKSGNYEFLNRYLSLAYIHKGKLLIDSDYDKGKELINSGMEYIRKIFEEGIDSDCTRDILFSMQLMGDMCINEGNGIEGAGYYEQVAQYMSETVFFTRSIYSIRTSADLYEKLFHVYVNLGYGMLARKWYDYALNNRNAVYSSSGLSTDLDSLNRIKKDKALLKGVYRAPKGVDCLIDVLLKEDEHSDNLTYENDEELKKIIITVVERFWKMHPLLKKREELLLLNKAIEERLSQSNSDIGTYSYRCGNVVQLILDSYHPFLKYDEDANIIVAFCGYSELKEKSIPKNKRADMLKDFGYYFRDIPMLYYPMDKVENPEIWKELYQFVRGDVSLKE